MEWLPIAGALVLHAVLLTAFFYREFATKRDLAQLEGHLRELAIKDSLSLTDKLATLHADVKDIQTILKDRMQWKS